MEAGWRASNGSRKLGEDRDSSSGRLGFVGTLDLRTLKPKLAFPARHYRTRNVRCLKRQDVCVAPGRVYPELSTFGFHVEIVPGGSITLDRDCRCSRATVMTVDRECGVRDAPAAAGIDMQRSRLPSRHF